MDKLIIFFLIIFGLLMTIIGIVDYKYPNLSWEYSLSRILHVKDGKPTDFHYSSKKIFSIFFMIAGPILMVAGTADLIWGNNATYDIVIEGEEIGIPCAYTDLEALGYQLEPNEKSEILMAGKTSLSYTVINADGEKILIRFGNRGKEDKVITECDVVSVYIEKEYGTDIQLSNGVTLGMSVSNVKSVMGKPDKGSSSIYSDRYVEQKWANEFEVTIGYMEDGGLGTDVSSISIQLNDD